MKYLIFNEYINQQMKNLDLRNEKLEIVSMRISATEPYTVGDYVEVDIVNSRPKIMCKVEKPNNFLDYFNKGKYTRKELVTELNKYFEKIKNENYKLIIEELVLKNENFFIFPAAKSIHHAYIGGLCEHTLNMLKIATDLEDTYKMNMDLLYAGIMLHDFGKIRELLDCGVSYTIEGNLIGHIVICIEEIANVAINLGINSNDDIIALKHLILSHHGRMDYGSPKEPMILEAYVLSVIDDFDAKMNMLMKSLNETDKKKMTPPLMAMDRKRFIKL